MIPLYDSFGRRHSYLRIAITDRCNLRCVYCMPREGIAWRPREEILTLEEIARTARLFVNLGIHKIRLTGGEPTIRHNLEWLIGELAAIPGLETLGMTTNGALLAEKARAYRELGLTNVNISLDTLRKERFEQMTLRDKFDDVLQGIDAALKMGFTPLKLNVVVMAGVNDDELLDFIDFAREKPVQVRFIEYMPFLENGWQQAGVVPYERMMEIIGTRHQLLPLVPADASTVAKEYAVPGHQGTISFITPMSADFCQQCNRLRLTADGAVKSCLLHPAEVSLRDALRDGSSDEAIARTIRAAVAGKPSGHAPATELAEQGNRSMVNIGG